MKPFRHQTLTMYLDRLASRDPTPGGGSAAALVAATGVALISMVARYSLKRQKSRSIESKMNKAVRKADNIRKRLLLLVDLDAKVYLQVVKARKLAARDKHQALKNAQKVPLEVCRLSYTALQLIPFLVQHGNPYLLSDAECAAEMLSAAFHAATANVKANQVS
ncbi:MAG TPA: cyclodeaminase/cyclohydrolase family protein [Candidatus Omnitrophota bacterium]|nr:cyclodeaminase/cyclohydrolase family protein [Candidatus Omnitrophota bacterium]HQL41708.1 cyclodeaminase/cyclohydrolase family protein [Candidatus Omnitrophota bacterium]